MKVTSVKEHNDSKLRAKTAHNKLVRRQGNETGRFVWYGTPYLLHGLAASHHDFPPFHLPFLLDLPRLETWIHLFCVLECTQRVGKQKEERGT